jgi:hypothetical protein
MPYNNLLDPVHALWAREASGVSTVPLPLPFPTVKVQLATPPENPFSSCAHFFIVYASSQTHNKHYLPCANGQTHNEALAHGRP